MSWWNAIWRTETKDWTYGLLRPDQVATAYGQQYSVPPDAGYLHVMLRRMRIPYSRQGWNEYASSVHCFTQLLYNREPARKLHSLVTPLELEKLGGKASKIEMADARLLGPVPYRGGDLKLELGLFSTKTDLSGPYLALLGKIASHAGYAATSALEIVETVRSGIDHLSSASDTTLEVGVANTFRTICSGCYVLMRSTDGLDELEVDVGGHLRRNKVAVTEPYIVFSIEATKHREDWRTLPDVGGAHETIQGWLRAGDTVKAKQALDGFRARALLSPDLVLADAETIVAEVEKEFRLVSKATAQGAAATAPELPPLNEALFDAAQRAGDPKAKPVAETPDFESSEISPLAT